MEEYVSRIVMPEGFRDMKREDVEKIIEAAITILNPDIKVHFAVFCMGAEWYATKKPLTKNKV